MIGVNTISTMTDGRPILILHCTKPQEDGQTDKSRIWSHFSSIEETVELPDDLRISHYTIASQQSSKYFGTILHEMYHQLGAADLYAVMMPSKSKLERYR